MSGGLDAARGTRLPRSARRKQLLAAAEVTFAQQGYHAAAMDDIADRAGVSKPVLYQHFPGKHELYLAVLDQHAEALIEAVRHGLSVTDDNEQRVHNTLSAYFDFVDGDPGVFRLLFQSDLALDPAVADRRERITRATVEAVADTVAADTGLTRERAELLARALTGSAQVAAQWWIETDRSVPKSEAVSLMVSLHWRGISHFPLV